MASSSVIGARGGVVAAHGDTSSAGGAIGPSVPTEFRKLWVAYFLRLHHLGQRPQPAIVDTAALLRLRIVLGVFALSRDAANECATCHRPWDTCSAPGAAGAGAAHLSRTSGRYSGVTGADAQPSPKADRDVILPAVLQLLRQDIPAVNALAAAETVDRGTSPADRTASLSRAAEVAAVASLQIHHAAFFVRFAATTEWLLCVQRTHGSEWHVFALVPGQRTQWSFTAPGSPEHLVHGLEPHHFTAPERPRVTGLECKAWAFTGAQPQTILEAHDAFRTIAAASRHEVWACEWLRAEEMQLLSALCGPTMTDDVSDGVKVASRLWRAPHALSEHHYPLSRLLSSRVTAPDWLPHLRSTYGKGSMLDPLCDAGGSRLLASDETLQLQAVEHRGDLRSALVANLDEIAEGEAATDDSGDAPGFTRPPPRPLVEGASGALWWLNSLSFQQELRASGPVVLAGYAGSGKSTAMASWLLRSATDYAFCPFDAVVLLESAPPRWTACVDDMERKMALAEHVITSLDLAREPTSLLTASVCEQLFAPSAHILWLLDHSWERRTVADAAASSEKSSAASDAAVDAAPDEIGAVDLAHDLVAMVGRLSVVVHTHTVGYRPDDHGYDNMRLLRACKGVLIGGHRASTPLDAPAREPSVASPDATTRPAVAAAMAPTTKHALPTTRVLWVHGLTRVGALRYLSHLSIAQSGHSRGSRGTDAEVGRGAGARPWWWSWGRTSSAAAVSAPCEPKDVWGLVERSEDLLSLMRLPLSLGKYHAHLQHVARRVNDSAYTVRTGQWDTQGPVVWTGAVLDCAHPCESRDSDPSTLVRLAALYALEPSGDVRMGTHKPMPDPSALSRLLPVETEYHVSVLKSRAFLPGDARRNDIRLKTSPRSNAVLMRLMCHSVLRRAREESMASTDWARYVFDFLVGEVTPESFKLLAVNPDDPHDVRLHFAQPGSTTNGMNGLAAVLTSMPREMAKRVPAPWRRELIDRASSAFAGVTPKMPIGDLGDPRVWQIVAALWPSRFGSLVNEMVRVITDMVSLRGGVQDLRVRTSLLACLEPGNDHVTASIKHLLCNVATCEEHLPTLAECWLMRDPQAATAGALATAQGMGDAAIPLTAAAAVVHAMCRVINAPYTDSLTYAERAIITSALHRIAVTQQPAVPGPPDKLLGMLLGEPPAVVLGAIARKGLVINATDNPVHLMPGASRSLLNFATWLDCFGLAGGHQPTQAGIAAAGGAGAGGALVGGDPSASG